MICKGAHPVPTKILKSLIAIIFLIKLDILSDRHLIKQETTVPVFFRHFLQRMVKCIQHMGIDAFQKMNSVEEGLQGRGNSV